MEPNKGVHSINLSFNKILPNEINTEKIIDKIIRIFIYKKY